MLTAITGGIGSGKSIVSRMLVYMGFPVYDCDREARRLMDESSDMKRSLCREIDPDCVNADGQIDRRRLGGIVFRDPDALVRLNSIVHSAVRDDLALWVQSNSICGRRLFVETAILYQSGIDAMVDDVWSVEAPVELRVERVMARNSLSSDQVRDRIISQDSFVPTKIHPRISVIINDGDIPLLPQVEKLIKYDINLKNCGVITSEL